MQGLWNLIGKSGQGPGKDFQYDIGEKVTSGFDSKSVWTLHNGKKRTTGDAVSIFVCDGKVCSPDEIHLSKTAHKRLKTLRHPNIIKYLDGFESESLIYVVTEPVTPLCSFLDGNDSSNSNLITWGLHQVTNGLSFLINNGNLSHDNINLYSIFVGMDGEWKLGGVEYVHPVNSDSVAKLPNLARYDPPEGRDPKNTQIWSADSWGLGCLIWEIYNGELQRASDLKSINKIPKPLVIHYCDLVSANPKNRTNPKIFLEKITRKGQFLNNSFIQANLFLQEIQIRDQAAQKEFFQSLDKSLDDFPKQFCIHKVLPQLLNAFEFGSAGSSVLSPLFKVGLLLDDAAYQAKIVPCIIKLFSSNDRATRIQLLQQMEKFVKHLQPSIVDSQIFQCVATGFGDTLPAMREQTVKAMLLLAPKLSEKTISNHLLRYFAKLQMDEQEKGTSQDVDVKNQPGIRTNTTICLGKIAQYLSQAEKCTSQDVDVKNQTRQKVLIPAFTRSLRDPFPPARSAGIMAIAATKEFYSMPDIACKVLPGLCACTVDHDKGVRDNAFKVVKMFLQNLEKYSNDPDSALNNKETAEREAKEQSGSTWTGWAVSSFTSRFYQPSTSNNTNTTNTTTTTTSNQGKEENVPVKQNTSELSSNHVSNGVQNQVHSRDEKRQTNDTKDNDSDASDYGDAWEEEWTDATDDFSTMKDDIMAVKEEVSKFSSHEESSVVNDKFTVDGNNSDSDYGDWGDNDGWGETKGDNDGWGNTKGDNDGWGGSKGDNDDWRETKKVTSKKKSKPSASSTTSVAERLGMHSDGVDFLTGESLPQKSKPSSPQIDNKSSKTAVGASDGWNNDVGWDDTPMDFGATKSSNSGWQDDAGGWSNDADDGWGETNIDDNFENMGLKSEQELKKEKRKEELAKKREERKLQRELANKERKAKGGGAMKLGAIKKIAS